MTATFGLDEAIAFAVRIHAGQRDKAGQPYILHPLRVMTKLVTLEQQMTAVLHDTIEDARDPRQALAELYTAKCPMPVIIAVMALTRPTLMSYDDYIDQLAGNPLARVVKLADLEDNLNMFRYTPLQVARDRPTMFVARITKYLAARQRLLDAAPS